MAAQTAILYGSLVSISGLCRIVLEGAIGFPFKGTVGQPNIYAMIVIVTRDAKGAGLTPATSD